MVLRELEDDGDVGVDLDEMFLIEERRVLVVRRHLWARQLKREAMEG